MEPRPQGTRGVFVVAGLFLLGGIFLALLFTLTRGRMAPPPPETRSR
jgi:hypothetical protein